MTEIGLFRGILSVSAINILKGSSASGNRKVLSLSVPYQPFSVMLLDTIKKFVCPRIGHTAIRGEVTIYTTF